MQAIPEHIAIIMDGNGRWAQSRSMGRTRGHREGAKRVDDIVTRCVEVGVKYLTLYAFSTENWNRPAYEVNMLWRLLVSHLKTMDKKLIKNRVSLLAQGTLARLPDFVQAELDRVVRQTHLEKPAMQLNLSLSYGGRQEIIDGIHKLLRQVQNGKLDPKEITEANFRRFLYHPEVPDPDLLIRTGGEFRVSNFLLWEIAYAEFYVTDVLWPDFHPKELDKAIVEFSRRQRRFGKTGDQVTAESSRAKKKATTQSGVHT